MSAWKEVMALVRVGGCFLISGVATAHFIGSRLPFPPVPDIAERFRYFADKKDEFDTIFIGSSRVRYQIIPQQFDAATAAEGVARHSFNLGYSGMWPPESYYFLRQVLALHPKRLRWVFIELMDYRFGEVEHREPTMRMMYWHDWQHTGMALRLIVESPLPASEKVQLLTTHAWLFLQRTTNPGRGAEWAHDRYFPSRKKVDLKWTQRRGFDPTEKSEWTEAARAELAQKVDALGRDLAPQKLRPGLAVALQDMVNDVHRAGAEPIFIIAPTVRVEENLTDGIAAGVPVWKFNNPLEYPQLYLPEVHYNTGHLNEEGAQEFTDLIARRFAVFIQTQ